MTMQPAQRRSAALLMGADRAPARAMLKAVGFSDQDLSRPLVGVANTWIEVMPCNVHLRKLAEHGKEVFSRSACIGCHTIQGVSPGVIGPNLTHVGSRATIASGVFPNDSAHLASWIADAPSLKPGAIMTRMKPPLTDADIAALVAYLQSLK